MPAYIYKCEPCKSTFEIDKPMASASRSENCPVCGGVTVRVYTVPMLNNWYVDYTQMDGEKERIDAGMYE